MFTLIYITTSGQEESARIGRRLVEEMLAACVNIIPSIKSFYHWEGSLEEDEESVLIVKTTSELTQQIIKRVRELHSYDNPCIISIPITAGGSRDYLEWLNNEVKKP
ncbi:divalent-cation tolerance protein CutA [Methanothermobacter marburgensis]|uniref:Predicted divalent ion tolerance protein n=1 Tax=Methanothermobacter marburgensis (strain ATCC BAA-927 / DSM 2133 / JCM 14651 / NBRC 100331 / OCM 82 / Marburg) TaxID=79929 RepID=D9PU06_METTM|nr:MULTISPECIES: divalent-cation tolerance protein CutA [Methanothermobacter]ADL57704.1 predicted divalent ion tolerance protein [Methanothermobacter marburgensis str. Marburg]WBF09931.1 divalent-cation tolerance protein CutA [Methanothermobacter marburgensis]